MRARRYIRRASDGLVLRGWFSPGARRDAVALVHGLGGNRASLLGEGAVLARHGHGVLLFDSRASGESGGSLATWGEEERLDVRAALSFLAARPEVDAARLGLYGFSVGATAVALEAAEDSRVRAVALGPVWPSLGEELQHKFGRWGALSRAGARWSFQLAGIDVGAVDALRAVARIPPRPLFFLSGTADADTPPAVMDRVHAAAPGATWLMIPGAGHGGRAAVDAAALDRGLGGFFDAALGAR
jgi:dienelactone hydrolase